MSNTTNSTQTVHSANNVNKKQLEDTIKSLKEGGLNTQLITLLLELRKDKNFKDILLLKQNKDDPYNPAFGNKQINQFTDLYNTHFTNIMSQLEKEASPAQLKLYKFFGLILILLVNGISDVDNSSRRRNAKDMETLYKISKTANRIYTSINDKMLSGKDLQEQVSMFKDLLKYSISQGRKIPGYSNNNGNRKNNNKPNIVV